MIFLIFVPTTLYICMYAFVCIFDYHLYMPTVIVFFVLLRYFITSLFTCVSYAEARNSYRLDVRPSVRPSVRHTLAPYQNG